MEEINIKQWYISEYPTDDLGVDINGEITFQDLFYELDRQNDIYDLIGVCDSLVRERLFYKLADLIGTDYDYIYEQWMLSVSY